MTLRNLYDALARQKTVSHVCITLADASANDLPASEEGYFQVRLAEMRLTDERRWLQEITPAALIVGEYHYNGALVRKPCFVSNESMG